ncbi:crotonase/enoyl-CoA hydratase family protein [Tenacibaculum sp. UWU-22]|uniref:crotonase/enoyl-CoA hydratase family protein n=1 Tax=Tenacibaculum sp. UWU-22 TaxID=3234187 RepID=UPI0034DB0002
MSNFVHYKIDEKHLLITINNGKANAISNKVIDELSTCLDIALSNKKIVIITGEGEIFSAGYDLKTMTQSPNSAKELVTKGSNLALKMLSFPLPIIIACNGHAIAKGALLLLACDYRIGVKGDFKIGLNEVAIGMTMHHFGIEITKARLAPVFFERSVSNAEIYNSETAVTAGFLDEIVLKNELLPTAIKLANQFSKLNLQAHANTKLKLRKPYIEAIKKAITLDLKENIHINLPSK